MHLEEIQASDIRGVEIFPGLCHLARVGKRDWASVWGQGALVDAEGARRGRGEGREMGVWDGDQYLEHHHLAKLRDRDWADISAQCNII